MNRAKLNSYVALRGTTYKALAAELGMNPLTFGRKVRDSSFKQQEIAKIINVLEIETQDAVAIFFDNGLTQECENGAEEESSFKSLRG